MIEIRVHGRGGQGAVSMVTILAKAVGHEGRYSQAFGAFGPERTGAPVKAFCRISENPITIRSQIYEPDYVIVLDPSLPKLPEVLEGVKPNTLIMVNSEEKMSMGVKNKAHFYDATSLALKVLGKNIVNTAMLGVFARVSGLVSLNSILSALDEVFEGKVAELNRKLVSETYKEVKK